MLAKYIYYQSNIHNFLEWRSWEVEIKQFSGIKEILHHEKYFNIFQCVFETDL